MFQLSTGLHRSPDRQPLILPYAKTLLSTNQASRLIGSTEATQPSVISFELGKPALQTQITE